MAFAAFPASVPAAGVRSPDYEVKAALIYTMVKFVSWPASAFESELSPFNVCIINDSAIGNAFDTITPKNVNRHRIQLQRSKKLTDLGGCHLVFIGETADASQCRKILKAVENRAVLTVGESEIFEQQGGIIRLLRSERRMAFEINPSAAKRSSLSISSKLLSLAKIVGSTQ